MSLAYWILIDWAWNYYFFLDYVIQFFFISRSRQIFMHFRYGSYFTKGVFFYVTYIDFRSKTMLPKVFDFAQCEYHPQY